jgi:hypothetical protein
VVEAHFLAEQSTDCEHCIKNKEKELNLVDEKLKAYWVYQEDGHPLILLLY